MIDEEHGGLGNFGWPPVEFDAMELVEGDLEIPGSIESQITFATVKLAQPDKELELDFAHFPVGDDEKVAAAAGGVEVSLGAEGVVEVTVLLCAVPCLLELGADVIQEER